MKKLKLYLETSVWNFFFADDAPELRDITKQFFGLIEKGVYDIYISDVVIFEIEKTKEKKKLDNMVRLIGKHSPIPLQSNQQTQDLAQAYLDAKIVPPYKKEDALHVAIGVLEELDAVISWNFRHLANMRKSELFHAVSVMQGYHRKVEILTPLEVMDDENS
jgi:hypothetical protein